MSNIKLEAYFFLKTPLHHGGDKTIIRPIGLPDKSGDNYLPHKTEQETMMFSGYTKQVRIPVVSGNQIRNLLRNLLVATTLHYIGVNFEDLSKNVRDMFTSGGGMDKKENDKNDREKNKKKPDETENVNVPLLIRNPETLISAFPIFGLFGCSYGDRIVEGSLKVGIAKPIFVENEHLFNGRKAKMHYHENILYYQMGTRQEVNRDAMKENDISRQNIFHYELASSGLEFHHTIHGENLSDLELSALQLALDFHKERALLGGKTSWGYGQITTDEWYQDTGVSSQLYLDWLEENKDTLKRYLELWDKPDKLMTDPKTIKWDEDLEKALDKMVDERRANIKSKLAYL